MQRNTKVAFVHDNFAQYGGAERVAEQIAMMLPDADIMSTVALQSRLSPYLKTRNIQTTWMQRLPAVDKLYRHYFLLYPLAVRSLNLSAYDVVISSCVGFAKGAVRAPKAVHLCYCHTPTRWIWRFNDYAARESFNPATGLLLRSLLMGIRQVDLHSADQPDYYIANSKAVAERIKEFYGRNAVVIYPPIDVSRFYIAADQEDYFLIVSRLLPYKRIDIAIEACNRLAKRLLIVGDGPDRLRLAEMAGPTVKLLGSQSDDMVNRLLAQCRAVLFPGEEDFGMVPIEANASGRPVIALAAGGAMETVIDGVTGLLYRESTPAALMETMRRLPEHSWDSSKLRAYARGFDVSVFRSAFKGVLRDVVGSKLAGGMAA
jgi:glycosyltransferase involved in cell wall biosynthesis